MDVFTGDGIVEERKSSAHPGADSSQPHIIPVSRCPTGDSNIDTRPHGLRAPQFNYWFDVTCMVCPLAPLFDELFHYGGRSQNYTLMADYFVRS